eukprot:394392_1
MNEFITKSKAKAVHSENKVETKPIALMKSLTLTRETSNHFYDTRIANDQKYQEIIEKNQMEPILKRSTSRDIQLFSEKYDSAVGKLSEIQDSKTQFKLNALNENLTDLENEENESHDLLALAEDLTKMREINERIYNKVKGSIQEWKDQMECAPLNKMLKLKSKQVSGLKLLEEQKENKKKDKIDILKQLSDLNECIANSKQVSKAVHSENKVETKPIYNDEKQSDAHLHFVELMSELKQRLTTINTDSQINKSLTDSYDEYIEKHDLQFWIECLSNLNSNKIESECVVAKMTNSEIISILNGYAFPKLSKILNSQKKPFPLNKYKNDIIQFMKQQNVKGMIFDPKFKKKCWFITNVKS